MKGASPSPPGRVYALHPVRCHAGTRLSEKARSHDEAGFVGGFEGLLFGLLLFVVGTMLVANAWAVIDTKAAADDAARQAARTYVEAPSEVLAADDAQQAAGNALMGFGRDPSRAGVSVTAGGGFGRCQRITVTVTYPSPLLELPWIGRVGSAERVRASHSELVDPYRTGLPGTATC